MKVSFEYECECEFPSTPALTLHTVPTTQLPLPSSHLKTSFQWAKVVFCELSENLQFPTPRRGPIVMFLLR